MRPLVDAELAKDPHLETRFLEHLPHPGILRRLARLDPASRDDRLVPGSPTTSNSSSSHSNGAARVT